MYEIISIGSSLVDILIHSRSFSLQSAAEGVLLCQRYGAKLEVDSFKILTGGGGSNTAVGFARLGFRTGVVTELGQDVFAQIILDEFHREKVLTNLVVTEKKEETGGSVILVDGRGGRTVLVHRGASSLLDPQDVPSGPVKRANWIHLSSINGRLKTLSKLFKLRAGVKNLSWNPGSQELNLLSSRKISLDTWPVEVFFVNKEEWLKLKGVAQEILHKTPVVVVTNGSQVGAVITKKEGAFNFRPPQVSSVDDTGAGDAFAVGFISEYVKHKPIRTAIRAGIENAQSVIAHFGAKEGLIFGY